MSRFLVLGDTHWGVRNDLPVFYRHFARFYEDLLQYVDDHGIKEIFQLGDLFDRRKYINFKTLSMSKQIFFDELSKRDIILHVLVGNHDIHMRESVEINSPELLLSSYDNIKVYSKPASVRVGDTTIDMIPWICKENVEQIANFIKESKSDLCFGHFEIAGFAMHKGIPSIGGMSTSYFEKYEKVLSGHYHTRSSQDNITYVGTPYEMTWHDYGDAKGWHIFDATTRELKFLENPYTWFTKVYYDDTKALPDLDALDIQDHFVKLYVYNKSNDMVYDDFCRRLNDKGPYDVKIIEDFTSYTEVELGEELNLEDTHSIVSNFIDTMETRVDKDALKGLMRSLYAEALNVEA